MISLLSVKKFRQQLCTAEVRWRQGYRCHKMLLPQQRFGLLQQQQQQWGHSCPSLAALAYHWWPGWWPLPQDYSYYHCLAWHDECRCRRPSCHSRTVWYLYKSKQINSSRFVDSGFVKTCYELNLYYSCNISYRASEPHLNSCYIIYAILIPSNINSK